MIDDFVGTEQSRGDVHPSGVKQNGGGAEFGGDVSILETHRREWVLTKRILCNRHFSVNRAQGEVSGNFTKQDKIRHN